MKEIILDFYITFFWICIGFSAEPDPAFLVSLDLDPVLDPGIDGEK